MMMEKSSRGDLGAAGQIRGAHGVVHGGTAQLW